MAGNEEGYWVKKKKRRRRRRKKKKNDYEELMVHDDLDLDLLKWVVIEQEQNWSVLQKQM
jgi:hypothetical protein